jgi:hypothetical protein
MAAKLGEPTAGWSVEHPSSLKEKMLGHWMMTYSLNGIHHRVYIGYNTDSATAGIKEIHKHYPRHSRKEPKAAVQQQRPRTAIEIPEVVVKLFGEWNAVIGKVGHSVTPAEYQRDYARHIKLLSQRAGILNMDMRRYLTDHPHAQYWPTPPMSQQQYDRRNAEFRKIMEERRRYEEK